LGKYWGKDLTRPALPATNSDSRPGDFSLGSLKSRAAARALADRLNASQEVSHVVVECIGSPELNWEFDVPWETR
jgi:hypothetical protein